MHDIHEEVLSINTIYCGEHLQLKSDAYVSDVRVVIQANRV